MALSYVSLMSLSDVSLKFYTTVLTALSDLEVKVILF